MALIDFTQIKGGKAVVDQVDNLVAKTDVVTTENVDSAVASDDKVMSEAAVEARLSTVQAGFSRQAEDEVVVNGAQATTEFSTSCVPTDDKLAMSVNGVVYVEDKHFTVDRSAKKVTWTYTATNGGFDLNEALTDSVKLVYLTREPAAAAPAIVYANHCFGMVLAQEGNQTGTWVRVDKDFNTVEFNPEHGTWAGMKQVQNETYGEFTEIPVTYVKTETLQSGPYAGKNCWWIADGFVDGFHVHPAFIGQDGQPHNLQIASWIASNKNSVPFSEDKGDGPDGYWNNISYNDMHAKGWMSSGLRPYNIYDHHFLARMMLTEFGTPDAKEQTVDGVIWTGANRITYHGIHDPFGLPNSAEYILLDGLTTLNGTYQVLAADGSNTMIETGILCTGGFPVNCLVNQTNEIDFGDLFIANKFNFDKNSGSFAVYQNVNSDIAFSVCHSDNVPGAFYLVTGNLNFANGRIGWRVAICS